mgnify:CR=1 FL=1
MIASKKVLVLNKNWTAIGFSSLQRVIGLLFAQYENGDPKAQIITPPPKGSYEVWTWEDWAKLKPKEGESELISSSQIFKIPEVILLTRYDKVPARKVNFCRREIWKRDEFKCQYCGIKPKYDESTIDHVVPKSRGGETSWTNCVLACYRCNSQKADREPHEAFKPNDRRASLWRGPSPMKLHKAPVRPKMPSFADERIKVLDTWKHWIDKLYWNVTLDNDMQKEGE